MTRSPVRILVRGGIILGAATMLVTGTTYGVSSLTGNSASTAAEVPMSYQASNAWTNRLAKAQVEAQLAAHAQHIQAEAERQKAEEEARKRAEEEARKRAEAEARQKAEEARKKAEARKRAEAEARQKAEARKRAEAEARKKAEARQKAAQRSSRSTQRSGSPKAIAKSMLSSYGWGSGQFTCLDKLWTRESNWNYRAQNPSSGAYGIPQALPGRKMASAGSDWRTNPATQIKWGLSYIKSRYGSPCAAWSHSQAKGWY